MKGTNFQLEARLSQCLRASAADKLLVLMDSLSNTDFRKASMLLGEKVLFQSVTSSDDFWILFRDIVSANSKAYLGTFLKGAVQLYKGRRIELSVNTCLQSFAASATPIDCNKILNAFLPIVRTPAEVKILLELFGSKNRLQRLTQLIKASTQPAYYQIFEELRCEEGDTPYIRQAAILLIRQNSPLSYNLASIVCQYFGLTEIPCTFSLQLNPYELSNLEHSYNSFLRILNK